MKTVSVGVRPDLEVLAVTVLAQLVHVCDAAMRVPRPFIGVVRGCPVRSSTQRTRAWYHVSHEALFRKCFAQEVGTGLRFQAARRRTRGFDVQLHGHHARDSRPHPCSWTTAERWSGTTQPCTKTLALSFRMLMSACVPRGSNCCAEGPSGTTRSSGSQADRRITTRPGAMAVSGKVWCNENLRKPDVLCLARTKSAAAALEGGTPQPGAQRRFSSCGKGDPGVARAAPASTHGSLSPRDRPFSVKEGKSAVSTTPQQSAREVRETALTSR